MRRFVLTSDEYRNKRYYRMSLRFCGTGTSVIFLSILAISAVHIYATQIDSQESISETEE